MASGCAGGGAVAACSQVGEEGGHMLECRLVAGLLANVRAEAAREEGLSPTHRLVVSRRHHGENSRKKRNCMDLDKAYDGCVGQGSVELVGKWRRRMQRKAVTAEAMSKEVTMMGGKPDSQR
eukprot:1159435-Pelagomonas_calceolata.AAC.4